MFMQNTNNLNNVYLEEIASEIDAKEIDKQQLVSFLQTDTNLALPNSIPELRANIAMNSASVALGKDLLKKLGTKCTSYHDIFQKTQTLSEVLLDEELKLGEQLKALPTSQGKRNDLKQPSDTDVTKSKTEVLKELKISERVANDIQKLTAESVKQAKENARKNGEIVTRKKALEYVKKSHFDKNNVKTDFNGIFDKRPDIKELKNKQPIKYTQLFASVGVGEEKLEQLGLCPSVANELEADRCKWYQQRHPDCKVIQGELNNPVIFEQIVSEHIKHKNKLLLASPVCRDFSVAGKRDFNNPRARLIFSVLELAERTNDVTEYILIENVPGFLTASPADWPEVNGKTKINLGTYVKQRLEALGYTVNISVIHGCDYDTAQKRCRAFILASKNGLWKFPEKKRRWKTLMETIGHLPSLEPDEESGIKWHDFPKNMSPETIEVLRHTPTGCSAQDNAEEYLPRKVDGSRSGATFKSHNMRNNWGMPAATVMQHNGNPGGHQTIHPGRPLSDGTWTDPRPFSILELLLISGLDENYFIPDWASDELVRNVLGDCLLPNVNLALCSMLPGRTESSPAVK